MNLSWMMLFLGSFVIQYRECFLYQANSVCFLIMPIVFIPAYKMNFKYYSNAMNWIQKKKPWFLIEKGFTSQISEDETLDYFLSFWNKSSEMITNSIAIFLLLSIIHSEKYTTKLATINLLLSYFKYYYCTIAQLLLIVWLNFINGIANWVFWHLSALAFIVWRFSLPFVEGAAADF